MAVNVPIKSTWNNKGVKQAETQLGAFQKKMTSSFRNIGGTLGGALAIGVIADKLKQMAMNAAEDQQSVVKLGKTLSNLGLSASQAGIEDFVKNLSMATGEVDDSLRPALDRLLKSTGNVAEAERALKIAQDAGVASGRSTLDIANLLGKAYDGNTMALGRAGLGIDSAILKSKDMGKITAELARITGGQAAAAAETYAGKIKRVETAAGEAQETIGYALLKSVDDLTASMGGTNGAVGAVTQFGDSVANVVYGVDQLILGINTLKGQTSTGFEWVGKVRTGVEWLANQSIPGLNSVMGTTSDVTNMLSSSGEKNQRQQTALAEEIAKSVEIRHRLDMVTSNNVKGLDYETGAATKAADAQKKHAAALDKVKAAFDRLNGKNRSVIEARLNMRELKASGPTATGGKNGKVITRDDRLRYALQLAEGSESLSSALFDKGNGSYTAQRRAAAALSAGRKSINGLGLGRGLAGDILSTPRSVTPAATAAASNVAQSVVNNFIFNGGINAATPQAAIEIAKKAARLSKLSGRHVNAGLG